MTRMLKVIAAALLVASSPLAAAQDEPPATASAVQAQEPVDEVVVRGKRTLFSLRKELQAARENVWDVFNTINSDDDFDIACTSAPQTGSHYKKRACRPQYATNATRQAGQDLARRMSACG